MNKLLGRLVGSLVCFVSFISAGYGQAVITSVTPNLGVTSGNAIVTIAGNNFQTPNAVTAVTFGTTPAYNFIVTSNNSITVQTSANIAGTTYIYLTTNTGIISIANSADRYTYDTAPTYVGPAVTVNVTQNVAFTTLNTLLAVSDIDSGQTETWTQQTAPSYGTITFAGTATTNSGNANITSNRQITYTPNTGYTGNDSFTIQVSDGYYTANQTIPVIVYAAPTVNSVTPALVTTNGGSIIQITGNNLTYVNGVSIGGANALSYTVNNSHLITAVVPSTNTAGVIDVIVSNPATSSATSLADNLRYDTSPAFVNTTINVATSINTAITTLNALLTVNDNDPAQTETWSQAIAPTNGTLSFAGGVPGTTTATSGNSIITASGVISYTPNASYTGNDTFTVRVSDGYVTANQVVNVAVYPVPTVNAVTPNYGSIGGGTTVLITGNNFLTANNILFSTTNAASFTINNDHLITAVTPNALSAGVFDVKVVNPATASSVVSADHFTYYNTPVVSGLSTTNGTLAGGGIVTITGNYFTGASSVLFGTTPATSYTVNSDSQITAVEPTLGLGSYNIIVTTNGGPSTANASSLLTTYAIPSIAAISTNNGPLSGGSPIIITGSNFTAATTVNFGATPVDSFTVNSSSQISTVVPAGALGTVDITVTTPGGVSGATSADQYAYYTTPVITWSTPADIVYPTPLNAIQLNALATYNNSLVSGNFTYNPPLGTLLTSGAQTLNVVFTPTDLVHYTTNTASVTLNVDSSPVITQQPQSLSVITGNAANFSVVASAFPPASYQWLYNGAPISGATTANYSIASVQTTNAGNYSVFVTNNVNSVLSSIALLTVTNPAALPLFTIQPATQAPVIGSSVTLVAAASGSPAPSYQWYFNNTLISGATNATYTLSNAQPANAGSYYVVATNGSGSVKSQPAFVIINPLTGAPTLSLQPVSQVVTGSSKVVFRATSTSPSATLPTYQWFLNGYAIAGANSANYATTATAPNLGNYQCIITTSSGSVLSATATLSVTTTSNPGRLTNLSVLSLDGSGNQMLTLGFVTGGVGTTGSQPLLIRGIGPALTTYNVPNILPDPVISLFNGSTLVNSNSGWGSSSSNITQVSAADAAVGAFILPNTASLDSAMAVSLTPSPYTVQVSSKSNATGNALAEVYDYTPAGTYSATTPRLVNLSCLQRVNAGAILTAGFTISGTTSKTVLIRASGPILSSFNIPSILPVMIDPVINVFSGTNVIASNKGWGGDPAISAAASAVGAFAFTNLTSADSALLITLAAGNYTVQVSSATGVTGTTLIEVYEVP